MVESRFRPAPEGWVEKVEVRGDRAVARLLRRGTEVHFEVDPEFRHKVIRRHWGRAFLKPLLEELEFLTTKVPHGDAPARRFVTGVGFGSTWSDADYEYFMLTALPFEKKEK